MKPIRPKKMPKNLEAWLTAVANGNACPSDMLGKDARAILAALEYERQRADKWARKYLAVPPQHRNGTAAVIMAEMMGPPERG